MPLTLDAVRGSDAKLFDGMNLHMPLQFDDGVKWMVRIRMLAAWTVPRDLLQIVSTSEVATIQLLHSEGARVPQAWHVPDATEEATRNKAPPDYFFMEFVHGAIPAPSGTGRGRAFDIPSNIACVFFTDLAQHHITLSNIKLNLAPGIGSIYPGDDGGYTLGPLISFNSLMKPRPPYFFGPFRTQRERYCAAIDCAIDVVSRGLVHMVTKARDVCLWLLEVKELVEGCEELGREETEFYIKHADDAFRQYLADEEGHITGVLDWEWAFATTKGEAFCSMTSLYHTKDWVYKGADDINSQELLLIDAFSHLGRPDLADCVRNGRIYQRIHHALRPRFEDPHVCVINATRKAFIGDGAGEPVTSLNEWRKGSLAKWGKDGRVKAARAWDKAEAEAAAVLKAQRAQRKIQEGQASGSKRNGRDEMGSTDAGLGNPKKPKSDHEEEPAILPLTS
ncbi:hypothetical protein IAT38_003712 [Cryptococcus sp. DSM 104549]